MLIYLFQFPNYLEGYLHAHRLHQLRNLLYQSFFKEKYENNSVNLLEIQRNTTVMNRI